MRRWDDNIRLDLKEIGIKTRKGLIRLRIGILESPREHDTEPPSSITHGVSQLKLQERDIWEGLRADGRTIVEWTLKK